MQLINLPFDEPLNSTIAQDFSGSGRNATLVTDEITTAGRSGNALYSRAYGVTNIAQDPVDYSGNFTVYMWAAASQLQGFTHTLKWMITMENNPDFVVELTTNSPADQFVLFSLVKEGNLLIAYRNDQIADTYDLGTDTMSGYVFFKDYVGFAPLDGNQYVIIDNFTIVDEAYSQQTIRNLILSQTTALSYIINGIDLKSIGVIVESAAGLFDLPEKKELTQSDWIDRHGVGVDIKAARYKEREMELDCWFLASTRDEAIDKTMVIKQLFLPYELTRFLFKGDGRFVAYDVYVKEKIEFEIPKWVNGRVMCKFTIAMREPYPVKRILQFTRNGIQNQVATISMSTGDELFMVYWGDGEKTANVIGNPAEISHTYAQDGTYHIIVSGVVDQILNLTSNANTVWQPFY